MCEREAPDVARWVKAKMTEHRRIFDAGADQMPLPVRGGVMKIGLKESIVPKRCPEPNWGHGPKRKILERWMDEKLRSGEFKLAPPHSSLLRLTLQP